MPSKEFWALSGNREAGTTSLLRIAETDTGPAITAVVILGEDINSTTLKKLRLGSVPLRDLGGPEGNPFSWLLAGSDQPQGLRNLTEAIDAAIDACGHLPRPAVPPRPARPPLTRPDRTDPDGHSRAVAAAYEEAVRLGKAPGPAIAAEAEVPIATAHGWIREARRRGKLPKGRRGRAG